MTEKTETAKRLKLTLVMITVLLDLAEYGNAARMTAPTRKGLLSRGLLGEDGSLTPAGIEAVQLIRVEDATGREVWRSGAVDADGRVDPKAVMYHSVLVDEKGEVTYLPWRAVKMTKEKLLHPKETARETYAVPVPADAKGPLSVTATLRYRSAPQDVLDALFGKGKLPVRTVDMSSGKAVLPLR